MERNDGKDSGPEGRKLKNIYARGADDGLWTGLYVIAIFALTVMSQTWPMASVPALAMMFGMPFLTFFFLKRTHVAAHRMSVFSALWMQGITMFACASIIFGLAAYCYLKWVNPGYVLGVLGQVAELYSQSPQESAQLLARECDMIVKSGAAPPASGVVMSMMWMVMFSGSMLSMVCALCVRVSARLAAIRDKRR